MFQQAIMAYAVENKRMKINSAVEALLRERIQIAVVLHTIKIINPAAAIANKMRMAGDVAVEPLFAVEESNAADLAVLLHLAEIAVDGREADIGQLGFQLRINPFRRRMAMRSVQNRSDCFPLPAVPPRLLCHGHLSPN